MNTLAPDSLQRRLAEWPDGRLRFFSRDGLQLHKTYAEVHRDVSLLCEEMRSCGIRERDVVGLLGENCYEWVLADLALAALDCVSVALPVSTSTEYSLDEMVIEYGLSALLLAQAPADQEIPSCGGVLTHRPLSLCRNRQPPRDARLSKPDVFTVTFSSGTTGKNKGLLLSKLGVANTISTSGKAWRISRRDDILIVMPFTHFQQRYLLYTAICFGCSASIVAPERMLPLLSKIEPTIIVGPPSFFEVLEMKIRAQRSARRPPAEIARAVSAILPERIAARLRRLASGALAGIYGKRVRLMFVGSAPSRDTTLRLFKDVGLPLCEVYGLTEFGWVSLNLPRENRIGTVGKPVRGVDIGFSSEREILLYSRAPQAVGYVFSGEEDEPQVFLENGRIATGDLGYVDDEGYLHLQGRTKNVIITRSGVKINPEEIEAEIEQAERVRKAVVVEAGGQAVLRCVVWLDEWRCQEATHSIERHIEVMNEGRPDSHRVVSVLFRPSEELTIDNGLLTRNCKIARKAVMERYFVDERLST